MENELDKLKRRLRKSVSVTQSHALKYQQEVEVNKELGSRLKAIKSELLAEKSLNQSVFDDLLNVKQKLKSIMEQIELNHENSSHFKNLLEDLDSEENSLKVKMNNDNLKDVLKSDMKSQTESAYYNKNNKGLYISEIAMKLNDINDIIEISIDKCKKNLYQETATANKDISLSPINLRKSKARRATSVFLTSQPSGTSLFRRSSEFRKPENDLYISDDESSHMVRYNSDDKIDAPWQSQDEEALFEHFLVVGCPLEAAIQFANHVDAENDSLSSRFMKKLGGFLVSSNRISSTVSKDVSDAPFDNVEPRQRERTISFSSMPNQSTIQAQPQRSLLNLFSPTRKELPKKDDTNKEDIGENATPHHSGTGFSFSGLFTKTPAVHNDSLHDLSNDISANENVNIESQTENSSSDENSVKESRSLSTASPSKPSNSSFLFSNLFSKERSFQKKDELSSQNSITITKEQLAENLAEESPNKLNLIQPNQQNLQKVLTNQAENSVKDHVEGNEVMGKSKLFPESPRKSEKPSYVPDSPHKLDKFNQSYDKLLENSVDLKISDNRTIATTKPNILFRFPDTAEPPPNEVADFCLPLGAQIRRLPTVNNSNDNTRLEILYGHSQSKRSGRCFVFTLEDKTIAQDSRAESTRLYGICVIHSRIISVGVEREFESIVCYAFITRFPFFDWFFQIIFDMLSTERLELNDVSTAESVYIPIDRISEILSRLTVVKPPTAGSTISFEVSENTPLAKFTRRQISSDDEEASLAAEWALPVLFGWLSPELIVWLIGLLLLEAKVLVVGQEPGIVTCTVLGLKNLLSPLSWEGPLIPVIPLKHRELIEAPVPLLAGLVVEYTTLSTGVDIPYEAQSILQKCNDIDNGTLTVVLDTCRSEVYLSSHHKLIIRHLLLPGAQRLVDSLKEVMPSTVSIGHSPKNWPLGVTHHRSVSAYTVSVNNLPKAHKAQSLFCEQIESLLSLALSRHYQRSAQRTAISVKSDAYSSDDYLKTTENEVADPAVVYSSHPSRLSFSDDELDDDEEDDVDSSDQERNRKLLQSYYLIEKSLATENANSIESTQFSDRSSLSGMLSSIIGGHIDSKIDSKPESNSEIGNEKDDKEVFGLSDIALDGDTEEFLAKFAQTQIFAERLPQDEIKSLSPSSSTSSSPKLELTEVRSGLAVVGLSRSNTSKTRQSVAGNIVPFDSNASTSSISPFS